MAIKLTKNEQKVQKDNLKQFERYLPTLQLKKQQLQSVIMKENAELEQLEIERTAMIGDRQSSWISWYSRIRSSCRRRILPVSRSRSSKS